MRRERLEKLIREDGVLKVRLDLCDVRLNLDAEWQEERSAEELKVDDLLGETEAAGDTVAGMRRKSLVLRNVKKGLCR